MVKIDKNLRAILARTYVSDATAERYTLGLLNPGEYARRPLEFVYRGQILIPKGTEVEAVILGTGDFSFEMVDGEIDEVLKRIKSIHTLFGVRVPRESSLFKKFTENDFATGVIYDATMEFKERKDFYNNTPATHMEAAEAHRTLYGNTTDMRSVPKNSEKAGSLTIFTLSGRRLQERGEITTPKIPPARGWEDITVSTVCFTEPELSAAKKQRVVS